VSSSYTLRKAVEPSRRVIAGSLDPDSDALIGALFGSPVPVESKGLLTSTRASCT
jgi:hypothetical protein